MAQGGAGAWLRAWARREVADARDWCAGRSWLARAPLLVLFAWIGARQFLSDEYQSVFGLLNLGFHELGHPLFSCLGTFLGVAGGTILQCVVPLASMVMFRRQPDWFALAICWGWLGTNFHGIARYCADARAGQLMLFSPFGGGGHVIHDWEYLLDATGLLGWDTTLATLWRGAAHGATGICLGAGGWLLWQMARGDGGHRGPARGATGPPWRPQ